jgi:hypothetical protein
MSEKGPDRSSSPGSARGWLFDRRDVAVLVIWAAVAAVIVFLRRDYCGDGLRHIPAALTKSRPELGEARWLLFPPLVYLVVHPLAALGIVRSVEGAVVPLLLLNLALSLVYLESLRRCLVALRVSLRARAAALALAAASAGLFLAATDLMEPMPAAALAMVGLTFAARRTRDPRVDERGGRQATLVAVGFIAFAALFYQGVILAIGLLPIVVPRTVLRDRKVWVWTGIILALVPITMWIVVAAQGHGAAYAAARIVQPGDNQAYNSYLKRPGLGPHLVALIAGPVEGLVGLHDFRGVGGIVAGLRTPGQHTWALVNGLLIVLGDVVLAAGAIVAVRRREWTLLAGFAALLILPVVVRYQQYGYLKYYVLLPVVLAIAASRARPSVVALIAAGVMLVNGAEQISLVRADRAEYTRRVPVYARAGAGSCWFTSGWAPRYGFRWPGHVCAVLSNLQSYLGEGEGDLSGPHSALMHCLEDCFCQSATVLTDDMTDDARDLVADLGNQFQFHSVDLASLTLSRDRSVILDQSPESVVMSYPPSEQRRLCAVIRSAHP